MKNELINEEYAERFIRFLSKRIKTEKLRPLTPKEFEYVVNSFLDKDGRYDPEDFHIKTDRLMEKQLTALGFDVSFIQKTERWYS